MGVEMYDSGNGNSNQIVKLRAAKASIRLEKENLAIIENFKFPTYNEIPDVGLYLEQTGKYINGFLSPLLKTDLTGSMISNYVKQKIVTGPIKKQYYRDHIVELIFIAVAKSILSLDSIKKALELEITSENRKEMYEMFCSIFEDTLKKTFHFKDEKPKKSENNATTLMRYLSAAVSYKIYLDICFDEPPAEEDKKQLKKTKE